MLIWDQAEVEVEAGHGGPGMVSFRRERFIPKGGPDGGDGGKGGDVLLVADDSVTGFLPLRHQRVWRGEDGKGGGSSHKTGRSGKGCTIRVPVGTIVRDAEHQNVLKDLSEAGASLVVARGGAGGRGNARFATAVRRVPRHAQPGVPGERRRLLFDLKLIADVGLVGLPNAGKSTLISRLSALRPKIADYPFTTLQPALGIVAISEFHELTFADLPGLIEGAHRGQGLGDRFLRHVERTRVLLHLIDVSEAATTEPAEAARVIEQELQQYSPELFDKPRLLVASKVESEVAEEAAAKLEQALQRPLLLISAVTGRGLADLKRRVFELWQEATESGSDEKVS